MPKTDSDNPVPACKYPECTCRDGMFASTVGIRILPDGSFFIPWIEACEEKIKQDKNETETN